MSTSVHRQQFVWSDAWLLLAIIYAAQRNSPASLADVIAAGDYINHDIFTRGELETGFSRLIDAGFVTRSDLKFLPTEVVNSFWISSASKKRYAQEALEAIRGFLGAPEWQPGALPETQTQYHVNESAYTEACAVYQQRFRRK